MSIYTLIPEEVVPDPEDYDLRLTERDIYGSSRLGTENINQVIASTNIGHININTDLTQVVGDKHYELSNLPTTFGIGNVLQVVTITPNLKKIADQVKADGIDSDEKIIARHDSGSWSSNARANRN